MTEEKEVEEKKKQCTVARAHPSMDNKSCTCVWLKAWRSYQSHLCHPSHIKTLLTGLHSSAIVVIAAICSATVHNFPFYYSSNFVCVSSLYSQIPCCFSSFSNSMFSHYVWIDIFTWHKRNLNNISMMHGHVDVDFLCVSDDGIQPFAYTMNAFPISFSTVLWVYRVKPIVSTN